MNPPERTVTLTLANGTVLSRTSKKPPTHAVVASALIPERVRRVVASGTHETLLETSSIYQEVYYSQTKGGPAGESPRGHGRRHSQPRD